MNHSRSLTIGLTLFILNIICLTLNIQQTDLAQATTINASQQGSLLPTTMVAQTDTTNVPEGLAAPEWESILATITEAEYQVTWQTREGQPAYRASNQAHGFEIAYPLIVAPSLASQVAKLTATNAATGDDFGWSVAVSGDTALVGVPNDDDGGINSGSVYIFERNEGGNDNWGQVAKLTAADAAPIDSFGYSVAVSGNTALVGAPLDDDDGSESGSAYIFERNEGGADNWGQVAKLTAADAVIGDFFGVSVAVSGDTALVGAPGDDDDGSESGSAYIFERNEGGAGNWGQVSKLTAADAAPIDSFGYSVAVNGNTALVGAHLDDDGGSESGSAYIFERNEGGNDNWGQVAKLTAADAAAGAFFGDSVAVSGDTTLVGAFRDDGGVNNSGSAYIFERNEGGNDNWGQVAKLTATDAAYLDSFGRSVAVSGNMALVGVVWDDDGGNNSGSAYVFGRNEGGNDNWGQVAKLTATDAAAGDFFGFSVAVSGDTALVGARTDDTGANNTGSAYIFYLYNQSPVAVDDDYATIEDTPLTIAASGVLTNDIDVDMDGLTAVLDTDVANGTLNLNSNGSFVYTPTLNFYGLDTFVYIASDGALTDTATVTITVTPVNDAPVANNDSYTTAEDMTLNIAASGVLTNDIDVDGDGLTAVLDTDVTNGTLSLNSDGSFIYTPTLNFNSLDTFVYIASDGALTDTTTVTITVTAFNDAPVANDDSYSMAEDTTLNIAASGVLTNDTDVDMDALTAVLDTDVTTGTLTLNSDGSFDYTPDADFCGSDSFTYHANDGQADSNVATVTIDVTCVNDPPVGMAGDDQTVDEGDTVAFSGSYTDPGRAAVNNAGGTAIHWDFGDSGTATGILTPTHIYADNGLYTVTLTITDSEGLADSDTLLVTVNNVAPSVTVGSDVTTTTGMTLTFTGVFTDPGTADTHTIEWDFGDGSTAAGSLTPDHAYADSGTYTVTFTITDDDGGVGSATLTVTVEDSGYMLFLPFVVKG